MKYYVSLKSCVRIVFQSGETPDISTLNFSTMKFSTLWDWKIRVEMSCNLLGSGVFNPRLSNHRELKCMFMVAKFMVKLFTVEKSGIETWGWELRLKSSGLKCPATTDFCCAKMYTEVVVLQVIDRMLRNNQIVIAIHPFLCPRLNKLLCWDLSLVEESIRLFHWFRLVP